MKYVTLIQVSAILFYNINIFVFIHSPEDYPYVALLYSGGNIFAEYRPAGQEQPRPAAELELAAHRHLARAPRPFNRTQQQAVRGEIQTHGQCASLGRK